MAMTSHTTSAEGVRLRSSSRRQRLASHVKRLDMFSRTMDELHIRTRVGGIVSILTVVIGVMVVATELGMAWRVQEHTHTFFSHKSASEYYQVFFDVEFLHVPCFAIRAEWVEQAGLHDVVDQMARTQERVRIDSKSGRVLSSEPIRTDSHIGAKEEKILEEIALTGDSAEHCALRGSFVTPRVRGALTFEAAALAMERMSARLAAAKDDPQALQEALLTLHGRPDLALAAEWASLPQFNFTHVIHELEFVEVSKKQVKLHTKTNFESAKRHPLRGKTFTPIELLADLSRFHDASATSDDEDIKKIDHHYGQITHLVTVVPTVLEDVHRKRHRAQRLNARQGINVNVASGVTIEFTFSPIQIFQKQWREGPVEILTSLCTAVAGVYVFGRLVDTALHAAYSGRYFKAQEQ